MDLNVRQTKKIFCQAHALKMCQANSNFPFKNQNLATQVLLILKYSPSEITVVLPALLGSFAAECSKWGFDSHRECREARRKLI
jgi:hypothetical protein